MLLLHIKPSGFQLWIVFMGVTVTLSLLQWRHAQNPSKEQEYCDSGLGGDLHVVFACCPFSALLIGLGITRVWRAIFPLPPTPNFSMQQGKIEATFFHIISANRMLSTVKATGFNLASFSFSNHWVFCPKLWDDSFCQQHNVVFIIIRNKDLFWKLTSW